MRIKIMRQKYLFSNKNIKPVDLPKGLFDKIILAIKREQELRQTRKMLFSFFSLSILSFGAMPFSINMFIREWNISGISYFISTVFGNLEIFTSVWRDFIFSILEALPVMGLVLFTINISLALFTIRLFLYKKGLLIKYFYGR